MTAGGPLSFCQTKIQPSSALKGKSVHFWSLFDRRHLFVRMEEEGFNSQHCSMCITPLAAAQLSVLLTLGVESETHSNTTCWCREPRRGAAVCVCGACLCLPTSSSHASGSFIKKTEQAALNDCPSRGLSLFTKAWVEISLPLLRRLQARSPPTHVQAHERKAPLFQPLTSCPLSSLGLSHLSWLFFTPLCYTLQPCVLFAKRR